MITRRRIVADDAIELRTVRDKITPPPVIGIHFGPGMHCNMPSSWDRSGDVPVGWTGYAGEKEERDDGDVSIGFRVELPEDLLDRIASDETGRNALTVRERQFLRHHFEAAEDSRVTEAVKTRT